MATEIGTHDAELEELMAQLEAETGVIIPATPAPTPAIVTTSEDDALLAELEVEVTTAPTSAPTASTVDEELLAALEIVSEVPAPAAAEAPVSVSEPVSTAAPVTTAPEAELSPEDELAALEAELNGEPVAATPKPTAKPVKIEEEHGVSFIPGAVLVDPEVEKETVALAASLAVSDTIAQAGLMTATAGIVEAVTRAETVTVPMGIMGEGLTAKEAFAVDELEGLTFFTDPKQFRIDTGISDHDLDRCFMEQSGLFSHYSSNGARSEAQHARLKLKFEVLEAKLYEEERRIAVEEGEKVTEKMLENRVKTNPLWVKTKLAVINAAGVSDINKGLTESLRHRKDMLVQMGADRRGEMQGQARMQASAGIHATEQERARAAAQHALQK